MFFESTPDFLYPDFYTSGKFKLSKNLFRRVRPRDNINASYASETKYIIKSGETPDSIAYSLLGSVEWYWTILLLNNITDYQSQWPLSDFELEKILDEKYGDLLDKPRHWETREIKDFNSNIVLNSGIIIEPFTNSTAQNATNYTPTWSFNYVYSDDGTTITKRSLTGLDLYKVTNKEYEHKLNDLKREIFIPKTGSLTTMESELEELLAYDTEYKITDEGWRESESPC